MINCRVITVGTVGCRFPTADSLGIRQIVGFRQLTLSVSDTETDV